MSTIPAPNHVLPVSSSLTASPVAVHEAHTLMTLNSEVLRCDPDIQPRLALSDAHIRGHWFRLMADPYEQFCWTSRQCRVMLLRREISLSSGGDYDIDPKAMPLL